MRARYPWLAGRVVVVAGEGDRIDQVTTTLLDGGALVGLVARTSTATTADVWFRVDPADSEVWSRVIPHVEQRLGPIDAAVATANVHAHLRELLEPDMRRRGHGGVLDIDVDGDVDEVVRSLATLL